MSALFHSLGSQALIRELLHIFNKGYKRADLAMFQYFGGIGSSGEPDLIDPEIEMNCSKDR